MPGPIAPRCPGGLRFCAARAAQPGQGEVTGLRPAEIDLRRKVWTIPAERSKNGYSHQVPLSEMALALLETAMNSGGWAVSKNVVSDIVWRYQIVEDRWTAHDLRRSALTKMAELGVAPIVLGHVANHRTTTKAGITLGVYVQHAYEREKREALELWASRLQAIIDGGAAKVVKLHK